MLTYKNKNKINPIQNLSHRLYKTSDQKVHIIKIGFKDKKEEDKKQHCKNKKQVKQQVKDKKH